MRRMRTVALVLGIAAVSVFAVLPGGPADAATQYVATTPNLSVYQSTLHCYSAINCNVRTNNLIPEYVLLTPGPTHAATVNWAATNGTAVAGRDFTGPTSGQAHFTGNNDINELAALGSLLYTANDNTISDTRSFTMHLSNPSIPADVSQVGTVTIYPHTQIPADCSFTGYTDTAMSLTCTNRPAGQHWQFSMWCYSGWTSHVKAGTVAVGDGTSTVNCGAAADSHGDVGTFAVTS